MRCDHTKVRGVDIWRDCKNKRNGIETLLENGWRVFHCIGCPFVGSG